MLQLQNEVQFSFKYEFIDPETKSIIKIEISNKFIFIEEFTKDSKYTFDSYNISTGFLNILRKLQQYFLSNKSENMWEIDFYSNIAQYFPRNETPEEVQQ